MATPPTWPADSSVLDIGDITKILPHRYPFLLVDKILKVDLKEGTIIAQKNVTYNEAFFQGHFPGVPIMPGVLILEALAQAGGILVYQKGSRDKIAFLLNVNQAKFRLPVRPGDVLQLHVKMLHGTSKGGKVEARALVGDRVAVEAEIGFALVDRPQN
jgi:3-hydroxyacyl-[acyl-carrier-protein] dehydratase